MFAAEIFKRILACSFCIGAVLVAAAGVRSQNPGDQLAIFCNGETKPEMETRWKTGRYEYYNYTLAEDRTGTYSFRFSSYWPFKFHSQKRGLSDERWPDSVVHKPLKKKDDQGRLFYYVDFDLAAPRERSSQVRVTVIQTQFDPEMIMVARVYSSGCTRSTTVQPPPPEPACRWVETMIGQPIANPYCQCGGQVVDKSRCGR